MGPRVIPQALPSRPNRPEQRPYEAPEIVSQLLKEHDQPCINSTWRLGSLQNFKTAKEARQATDPQELQLTLQDCTALKQLVFHSHLL